MNLAESLDPRLVRLSILAGQARTCTRCRLAETRTHAVFARGNPFAELAFVGEAPGEQEDMAGEPFVGPSGALLDRLAARMGFGRDEVYVCNLVKCRPPKNRKPMTDEVIACRPYVEAQLADVRPKVIVALGAVAAQGLLRTNVGITKLRGTWKEYDGTPVMPTFHPAYLLRVPSAKAIVWQDMQIVLEKLGRAAPEPST